MKQKVRELLLTAKAAQNWQEHFEKKVDELMEIVNRADTDKRIFGSCELLDVYNKKQQKPAKIRKKKLADTNDKPFEFLVFRN